jgi:predicted amidophosphoribosyltransferase
MKCAIHNGDIYMVCMVCGNLIRWLDRTDDGICAKCKKESDKLVFEGPILVNSDPVGRG